MADKEKPVSNILRPPSEDDKYLKTKEDREAFFELMKKRMAGEHSFGAAGEEALKQQKLDSVKTALMKKMFLAQKTEDSDRRKKFTEVSVAKFTDDALKQLNISKKQETPEEIEKKKSKDSDFLTKLFTAALPLLMVGGGLLASVKQMMSGGPLQGISNILSKGFMFLFNSLAKALPQMPFVTKFLSGKMMTTSFGKLVGKTFVKRLPIIGSIISLGSAWKRMTDGDVLGGLIDVGAAVAYMFPGVGTVIGIALDVLNAGMDIAEAKQGETGFVATAKQMFAEWFKKNARHLPILGLGIRLGEAIGYLVGGDIKMGIKGLFGAAATSIPGLSLVYDWLFGSTDPDAPDDKKKGNIGDLWKKVSTYIRDVLWEKIKKILDSAKNWVKEKAGELGAAAIGLAEDVGLLPPSNQKTSDAVVSASNRAAIDVLRSSDSDIRQKRQAMRMLENQAGMDMTKVREKVEREYQEQQAKQLQEQTNSIKELIEAINQKQEIPPVVQNTNQTNQTNILTHQTAGLQGRRDNARHMRLTPTPA